VTTETVAHETSTKLLQAGGPEPELLVRIPRDAVSVLGVSLDLSLFHAIQVHTTEQLRSRISTLCSLPQGK